MIPIILDQVNDKLIIQWSYFGLSLTLNLSRIYMFEFEMFD